MFYWDEISSVLHRFEGPQQVRGYIPCDLTTGGTANYLGGPNPERYVPMGVSGVTIGTGVDLGQTDADTLRGMGVPDAVIRQLVPYLGKRKADAVRALHERPLVISAEDADVLDAAMLKHHVGKISARYDRDAGEGAFEKLPWQAQAVIVSIQYQRGVHSPSKYKNTWRAFVRQDWKDAAYRLKTRRFWSGYQDRRYEEGRILEDLC